MRKGVFKFLSNEFSRRFLARFASNSVAFCFHRVLQNPFSCDFFPGSEFVVSQEYFERFLWYVRRNFRCCSLEEFVRSMDSPQGRRTCHITFDDGFADTLAIALPLLEYYRVPASVFVTSGFVDRSELPVDSLGWYAERVSAASEGTRRMRAGIFSPEKMVRSTTSISGLTLEERAKFVSSRVPLNIIPSSRDEYLTLDQLRILASSDLISIGSHTKSHANLAIEDLKTVRDEVSSSKDALEAFLKVQVDAFAYPYGGLAQVTPEVVEIVRQAGYKIAFTTSCHSGVFDVYRVPRYFVTERCTDAILSLRTGGLSNFLQRQCVPNM